MSAGKVVAPPLGIVEAFYGPPWPDATRIDTIRFLAPHGYRFFIHAPKAAAWLREDWRRAATLDEAARLAGFASACDACGVVPGVGLSPVGALSAHDDGAGAAIVERLALFRDAGIRMLALLLDDQGAGRTDLPEAEAALANDVVQTGGFERIVVCPTWYSDDPRLDALLGPRPARYLERLGALLDPAIDVFWTGETIVPERVTPEHLARVGGELRRKPVLWDNYPVNDGARMSAHLHLRPFRGRPPEIGTHLAAHAINPALQPVLTRIPAITLAASYANAGRDDPSTSFERAATAVGGPVLATMLRDDLPWLHDRGLDRLGDHAEKLRTRYRSIGHRAAREIESWLDGAYRSGKVIA